MLSGSKHGVLVGLHLLEVGEGWYVEKFYEPLFIIDRYDCWFSLTFLVDSRDEMFFMNPNCLDDQPWNLNSIKDHRSLRPSSVLGRFAHSMLCTLR